MKIILIGNYPPDKQESMKLFARMLQKGFQKSGYLSEIWYPKVFMGFLASNTNEGFGKWLGYIDKWLIFPLYLRIRLLSGNYKSSNSRFLVCDHSNSPYLAHLPPDNTVITCHDVLAIRGAFGFKDAYCEASRMGIVLQKWILRNLIKANKLACVSKFTMRQLNELITNPKPDSKKDWRVIHNAFNQEFYPVEKSVAKKIVENLVHTQGKPYLLHVGSSLPRKNRKLLIEMLALLSDKWDGEVYLAGQAIDSDLMSLIEKHGLQQRIKSIVNPNHDDLLALYNACSAFVFPSYSEGFGWPVIEAQACGVPVITSDIEPMPEVSGRAALHLNPDNAEDFANAFLSLSDNNKRDLLVKQGLENCRHFAPEIMINEYLSMLNLNKNKR